MSRKTSIVQAAMISVALGSLALTVGGCPTGGGGGLPGSHSIELLEVTDALIGGTGMLRVTLVDRVAGNTAISLTSSDPNVVVVPASATVVAGSDTVSVAYTAVASGAAAVTAELDGSARTAVASVLPSLSLSYIEGPWSAVQTGAAVRGWVDLNLAVPEDVPVTLSSSDPTIAAVPTTVTVRQFDSSADFPITAGAAGTATITGEYGGVTQSVVVSVVTTPVLAGVSVGNSRLLVGQTVRLNAALSAVPADAATLTLTSSDPATATVPASVAVPAGELDVEVAITGLAVGTTTISVEYGGTTQDVAIAVVDAPSVVYASYANRIQVGAIDEFYVDIDLDAVTDTVVTLTSSDSAVVAVPATLTIPAGRDSAFVRLTALSVGNAVITAQLGSSARSCSTTVVAMPALDWVSTSKKLQIGAVSWVSVGLDATGAADMPITITNSSAATVAIADSAAILAGDDGTTVALRALAAGSANITIDVPSLGQTRTITIVVVTTPAVSSVSLGAVKVGAAGTLTVSLDAVPASNQTITLTNSAPGNLSVPATMVVPAGSTDAAVSTRGLAAGNATVTATLGATSDNDTVAVTP